MIYFITLLLVFLILDITIKNKNVLTNIYCIILIVTSGFRSYNVGTDTQGYYLLFRDIVFTPFRYFFDNFLTMKDPFFYITIKFFRSIMLNERTIFLIFSTIFVVLISKIIRKYSNNKLLTYVMFICLPYFFFSMTALRQGIALAFCFYSVQFLIQKKYKKFILSIIFGSLFHKTALVFLISPFICKFKVKFVYFLLIPLSYIISVFFKTKIYDIAIFLLGSRATYYIKYTTSLNSTLLFLNTFMLLLIYFLYKNNKKGDIFFEKTFNLYLFGILILPFCGIIAEFFRISMYFMIVVIILLPNAIKNIKNEFTRKLLTIMLYLIMIMYMIISNGNNYGIFPYSMFGG